MIVPEFWAEARIQERFPDRQVTVRRAGWSDESQEAAQAHADQRARDAFDRIVAGEELPRREPKVRYNGADGIPIREPILERFGDAVVTRNSYGARCLNSPDVFFADVDYPGPLTSNCLTWILSLAVSSVVGFWLGNFINSVPAGLCCAAILTVLFAFLIDCCHAKFIDLTGGNDHHTLTRIRSFANQHANWHIRVYRTPKGFRIAALHKLFDPRSIQVENAFVALRVDQLYRLMSQKQNCFRARLTAKPWRIGISNHIKPRPGVWPIREEQLEEYNSWVTNYEQIASDFAACEYEESLGDLSRIAPKASELIDFHDSACRALSGLPIA